MQLGKKRWATALVTAGMMVAGDMARSQNSTTAQQNVPDAPKPQTLPRLNTITPVGPALPNAPSAPGPLTKAGSLTPGSLQPEVPSSLPASPTAQTPADEDQGPPPESSREAFNLGIVRVNFVEVPFTVKDSRGQLVPGLTYRDVRVYENNLRQHLSYFSVDPFPLSVALVIDQSVTQDVMSRINNSLSALQNAFTPYDEVTVFTYNNGVRQQTAFTSAQSARLGAILERSKAKGREPIMGLGGPLAQTTMINNKPNMDPTTSPTHGVGNSLYQQPEKEYHTLNDAILAAAQETTKAGKGRRRVVYVISDGKEYGSKASQKEVIHYLQQNQVAVYATLVGDASVPGMGFLDRIHLPLTMREDVLPRYAAATGGQCDPEFRQAGIERSFAKITETVRTQYTAGYYSKEPVLDGKLRTVEVRVMRPNLTVVSKSGYYPTPSARQATVSTPVAVP